MSKYYIIRGAVYAQKETTFEQDKKLREILSGKFDNIGKLTVLEFVDRLYFDGVLRDVFRVVLVPVPFFLFWNLLVSKARGFALDDPFGIMRKKEIFRVATDFFTLSASFLTELLKRKGARDLWQMLTTNASS